MIALNVTYTVKPGKEAAVLEALGRMKQAVVANEPGCLIYQVSKLRETTDILTLYEVYQDESALEAHSNSVHFNSIIKEEVVPMLTSRVRSVCDVKIS